MSFCQVDWCLGQLGKSGCFVLEGSESKSLSDEGRYRTAKQLTTTTANYNDGDLFILVLT